MCQNKFTSDIFIEFILPHLSLKDLNNFTMSCKEYYSWRDWIFKYCNVQYSCAGKFI